MIVQIFSFTTSLTYQLDKDFVSELCVCRMEKLRLGTRAGKVKTIGALLCVTGAMITGLVKGKEFYIGHHHIDSHTNAETSHPHWARGTILLVASSLSYSSWFIAQVYIFVHTFSFPFFFFWFGGEGVVLINSYSSAIPDSYVCLFNSLIH